MRFVQRGFLFIAVAVCAANTNIVIASAVSALERGAIRGNYELWRPPRPASCSAGDGDILIDGKVFNLPAEKGYTAKESPIELDGTATELGSKVTFAQHASNNKFGDNGEVFRDYAINMRWTYTSWYWDGSSTGTVDDAQRNWMASEPRLVTVTNPRTHKSVITAILESGPAPWTGTEDTEVNNNPKYGWLQPQLGTPPEGSGYNGRVSGLTPKAMAAIEALPGVSNGGTGDELLYAWTPDQNAKPGTVTTNAVPVNGANKSCGGAVSADGYAFPVNFNKATLNAGYNLPCISTCHHDFTPAFDFSHDDTVSGGNDSAAIGTPVYAMYNGTIAFLDSAYSDEQGCYSFQLYGDDGWHYWYGHVQPSPDFVLQDGAQVKAGQQIAVIGERRCTGNGSYPHLHIDRGAPQGGNGGMVCCRDPGFVPLINSLYELLP